MKKVISIFLFVVVVAALIAVALLQYSSREEREQKFTQNCETLPSSSFTIEKALGVIVRNKTLLTVRLKNEKNFAPTGGHVDSGETPKQAVIREINEEVGLKIPGEDAEPYKTVCRVIGATKTERTHYFVITNWEGILSPAENTQIKWVTHEFRTDSSADTELVTTLDILKADGRID